MNWNICIRRQYDRRAV